MSCPGEWRIAALYGLQAPHEARTHVAECADCADFLADAGTLLGAYRSAPAPVRRRWAPPRRAVTAPLWVAAAAALLMAALVAYLAPAPAPPAAPGAVADAPAAPPEIDLSALPEPDVAAIDREIRSLRDAIRAFAETLESEDAL